MNINGQHFHTIWAEAGNYNIIRVIDQQKLPFEFNIKTLKTFSDAKEAISKMTVRGAPLIGVTAAYGIFLALLNYQNDKPLPVYLKEMCDDMKTTRPTAVNLAYAVDIIYRHLKNETDVKRMTNRAFNKAEELKHLEIDYCNAIGEHGLPLIEQIARQKPGKPVNILTHCNAGWLASIDWGTALAPVYKAHLNGIPVHVWVDETRPRNQGSRLTAFELQQQGVPFTVIPDNTGGHLMQHGKVDMVLVGSDRTTRTGDVCNKIGTYLKALAAFDNGVPFYVALPSSSIDFSIANGLTEIPIEERNFEEVQFIEGKGGKVQVTPDDCPIANYGFDVTPARLVAGLITERGICEATEKEISNLFPNEKRRLH
ncbi:MAG: S-methyl-5-thioribose-1-phosphate isomerase [Prolixibacteraceae bacterium]|nr:S-methyl-5-thioribose-1-phosphate isomerase [Prolixibacteraceae bacterium]